MQVAVTGAGGRVGRAVIALLRSEGHEVLAVDRTAPPEPAQDGTRWTVVDTTSYEEVVRALEGCEALVHLAAIPRPVEGRDADVHNNNVVSSYNCLLGAIEVGIRRICQASSVNAIGAGWSREPHFDYFPVDESHPTSNEDGYSLSKWIAEQQADSLTRRHDSVAIATFRLHMIVDTATAAARFVEEHADHARKILWGYLTADDAARAFLLGITAPLAGHEIFWTAAATTCAAAESEELVRTFYPEVEIRSRLSGHSGFFDCRKAERLLGWSAANRLEAQRG